MTDGAPTNAPGACDGETRPATPARMARRLQAAAALLLAASAALWPTAHAQEFESPTARIHGALVGNVFAQEEHREKANARDWAQGFTTGSAPSGYVLAGVELRLSFDAGAQSAAPTVTLHRDDPLSAALATLSGPSAVGAAPPLFTAPANTVLARDSTYYVVLEGGGSNVDVRVTATSTPATDRGGEADWSIADTALDRGADSASTTPFSPHARRLQLLVHGLAVGAELDGLRVTDANGAQAALSPAFAAGTTAYVAEADPGAGPLTVAATTPTGSAVEFRDVADAALADADPVAPGHQVAFDGHPVTVRIRVTGADGAAGTYALHLRSNDVLVSNLGQGGGYDRLRRIQQFGVQEIAAQAFTAGQAVTLRGVRVAGVAHEPPPYAIVGAQPEVQNLEYVGWAGGAAEYRVPAGRTMTLRQGANYITVRPRGDEESSLVGTLAPTAPEPSPLDPGAAPGWELGGKVRSDDDPVHGSTLGPSSPFHDRTLRVAVLGSPVAPPQIKRATYLTSNTFRPVLALSDSIIAQRIHLSDFSFRTFALAGVGVHVAAASPDLRLRLFDDADGAPGAKLADLVPAAAIVEGRVNTFVTKEQPVILRLGSSRKNLWLVADRHGGLAGQGLGLTDKVFAVGRGTSSLGTLFQRATAADDWSATDYRLRMDVLGIEKADPRGHPELGGRPLTGGTLNASTTLIEDDNGLGPFAYRWLRVAADDSETVIPGADGPSYVVTEDDEGFRLKVVVSYRDLAGFDESLSSGLTVVVTPPTSVRFNAPYHPVTEGRGPATVSVELYQRPGDSLTFPLTVPLTVTYQYGASAADHSAVPAALTFTAPDTVETFTVSATDDAVDDAGERVVIGFGTLPAGLTTRPPATATLLLSDPASAGDVRLTDQAGVPALGGEGRLEVYYRGEWGTVCDDRMDAPDNDAPKLACQLLGQGYEDGILLEDHGYASTIASQPIWLDDLRCYEGSTHWTDSAPTQLDHCYHAGIGLENCDHSEDVALQCLDTSDQTSVDPPPPLRATLQMGSVTSHDGSAFTFRVAFTRDVSISASDMRDHALDVGGATVSSAAMVDGRGDLWEIGVTPTGTANVTILVPFRSCDETGALCTSDGTALTRTDSKVIPYVPPPEEEEEEDEEEEPAALLTAAFESVPEEHSGDDRATHSVKLLFSEEVKVSNNRMRKRILKVENGTLEEAGRIDRRKDYWRFSIRPDSHLPVTLSLKGAGQCGARDVICTFDDRPLSAPVTATIEGPPGLSVADARASEGPGATLEFAVTLDRAPRRTATVNYETHAVTATEGEDYARAVDKLTFEAGETLKTVSVSVLEDEDDTEGEETLTLRLSGALLAWLKDREATGTIGEADAVQNALVDGAAVVLVWPTARDAFGTPSGSDYAVRVNGIARRVVSAQLSGRTGHLELATPVLPGDAVTVAYLGSAMHPLADASGLRSGPWEDLGAVNVTGTEYPLPVHVAPMPHGGDPLASAAAGALRLNASGAGLTDLPSLAHLMALERLDLSGNALTDLSPLSGLINLRDLDLSDNRIADLWPLSGLQGLERLDLSGNRVVDLWPLAGLSNLTVLVLDGNAVTDLGALTHLAKLENLGLAGTGVGDVTALQDLPVLRRLDLGGTGVANLLPLTDVGSLVWLSLPGDGLGAPETLGRLTRLRWVWSIDGAGTHANGPGPEFTIDR